MEKVWPGKGRWVLGLEFGELGPRLSALFGLV